MHLDPHSHLLASSVPGRPASSSSLPLCRPRQRPRNCISRPHRPGPALQVPYPPLRDPRVYLSRFLARQNFPDLPATASRGLHQSKTPLATASKDTHDKDDIAPAAAALRPSHWQQWYHFWRSCHSAREAQPKPFAPGPSCFSGGASHVAGEHPCKGRVPIRYLTLAPALKLKQSLCFLPFL